MASTCTKDGHKAEHGKCFEFVMLSTVVELWDSVNLSYDAELVENYHHHQVKLNSFLCSLWWYLLSGITIWLLSVKIISIMAAFVWDCKHMKLAWCNYRKTTTVILSVVYVDFMLLPVCLLCCVKHVSFLRHLSMCHSVCLSVHVKKTENYRYLRILVQLGKNTC